MIPQRFRKNLLAHGVLITFALTILAVFALFGATASMTVDFAQVSEEYGDDATKFLAASGYPRVHPEAASETYQFIGVGPEGNEMVTFHVDWTGGTVQTFETVEGDADLVARLPPGAFDAVVARVTAIQAGHVVSSEDRGALAWDLIAHTDVEIRDKNALAEGVWKTRFIVWATTMVVNGSDGLRIA